ncbi:MAG: DUF2294 domain-containing protein [bacterium]
MSKTRGQLEAEISDAMVRFELDYMGRGPEEARTYIIEDLVVVRLRGVLTQAEKQLAGVDGTIQGWALVKEIRRELIEKARPLLETIVHDVTGQEVRSLHTDISTRIGERIIVFSLAGPVRLTIDT